jgi:hypothetical protein
MPRKLNPADISVGTGRAQPKSVDASSFTNPTQGTDGLAAHIADPRDAHMAATIGIVDAGGFYTSDDVEGALQEIGAGATGFRQNGWFSAGVADFDTAASDAVLTITLAGSWVALLGAGSVDVSGDSIALPDNTTRWVYIDSAGVLTASAGVPNITTTENVIVGFFTTAGGAVTGKVDGRFFVRNDNRKIDYSVRASGAAADANSEACFFSLDAALLWVDTFNTSGVSQKTHLTIRGSHTLSSTVTLGTDNVVFQGEDGATFLSGATVAPMFDLNGQSGIEFHNITFSCAHAASTAIEDTSASLADLRVEKCVFAGTWVTVINLDSTVTDRAVISDTVAVASLNGIYIAQPQSCAIVRTQVTGVGGGVASGISLGDPTSTPTSINSLVDQCRVEAFDIGVYLRTLGSTVSSSTIVDCVTGAVFVDYGSLGISVTDNNIVGTNITQSGIGLRGSTTAGENTRQITVSNNKMLDLAGVGIGVRGYVTDSVLSGNTIDCYAGNATNPTANGIYIEGLGAEDVPTDIIVTNNAIRRCKKGVVVAGAADVRALGTLTVVNNANVTALDTVTIGSTILTAVVGAPAAGEFQIGGGANATATNLAAAINLPSNGLFDFTVHAVATANVVAVYAVEPGPSGDGIATVSSDPTGILALGPTLTGGEYHNIRNITITDNAIHHCAVGQAVLPSPQTVDGVGGVGVLLYFSQNCTVSGNNIHDIGILLTGGEVPFFPPGAGVYSNGIIVWNSSAANVTGNNIYNVTGNGGGYAQGVMTVLQNTSTEPTFAFVSEDIHFDGNLIEWQRSGDALTLLALPGVSGVVLALDDVFEDANAALVVRGITVDGNTIRNTLVAAFTGLASSSTAVASCSNVSIRGNKISPFSGGGVVFLSSDTDIREFTITDNVMKVEHTYDGTPAPYMDLSGIYLETLAGGAVSNIEQVTISNNTIFASQSAINLIATGEGSNITITGNTLRMAGDGTAPNYARAIRMNLGTEGTKGTSINDITITGNVLEGGDGVRINSAFGVLVENVIVTGNTFNGTDNDTDPTPAFPDGFYAAFSLNVEEPVGPGLPIGDILRNVVISGNTFSNTQREAIAVTKGDTVAVRYVHGVNITNNTLDLCALGSLITPDVSSAILVNVLSTTSLDIVSDINVVGNTFTNTKVYNDADAGLNVAALVGISSTTAVLGGLRVSGNNFTKCETVTNNAATCVSGSIVVFSIFGLTTLDFSDNKFVNPLSHATSSGSAAIAGVLAVYCPLTIANVIVANNQASLFDFQATSSAGDANPDVIFVSASVNLQDVSVQGNTFFSGTCDATATGVEYPGLVFLSGTTSLVSAQVSNNTFYSTTLVYAGAVNGAVVHVGSNTITRGVSILDNVLTETSAGGNPQDGLRVRTPTSVDTLVSGNNLRLGTGVLGRGILVENQGAGVSHTRVNVSNNTVSGFNETIAVLDGNLNTVVVSGNTVDTALGGTPKGVWLSGDDVGGLVVSNNNIDSTNQGVFVDGGGTGALTEITIVNNMLLGTLQEAIWVSGSDGPLRRLNVSGNTVADSCTYGIRLSNAANALDRQFYDVVVQGNNLNDPTIVGISLLGSSTNPGSYVDIRGVTVSGNVINALSGSLTGISVSNLGNETISSLTCTGNVLRLGNTSVGVNIDGNGTSANLVFQGNAVTGLNAGDNAVQGMAGLDPGRVIVMGNTSDASGGGLTWRTWYAALWSVPGTEINSPDTTDVDAWNWY